MASANPSIFKSRVSAVINRNRPRESRPHVEDEAEMGLMDEMSMLVDSVMATKTTTAADIGRGGDSSEMDGIFTQGDIGNNYTSGQASTIPHEKAAAITSDEVVTKPLTRKDRRRLRFGSELGSSVPTSPVRRDDTSPDLPVHTTQNFMLQEDLAMQEGIQDVQHVTPMEYMEYVEEHGKMLDAALMEKKKHKKKRKKLKDKSIDAIDYQMDPNPMSESLPRETMEALPHETPDIQVDYTANEETALVVEKKHKKKKKKQKTVEGVIETPYDVDMAQIAGPISYEAQVDGLPADIQVIEGEIATNIASSAASELIPPKKKKKKRKLAELHQEVGN